MRNALLALLALTAAWTAGCVGSPGETLTMRDGLGDARAAGGQWGDDLQLTGAMAIEPFRRVVDEDEDGTVRGEFVTHLDRSPGDGRAPGWLYAFLADDGRCVYVAWAAGLGSLAEGWEDCGEDDEAEVLPLPDGILDSDDVADLLAAHADWPEADDSATLTWDLFTDDDGVALWEVSFSNATQSATAVVDARSGNVTVDEEGSFLGGSFESASATASAAAVTPVTPLVLSIDLGDDAYLSVTASAQTSLVGLTDLVVVGPGGEITRQDIPGTLSITLEGLPEGPYEIRIEHDNVALTPTLVVGASWYDSSA